MSIFQNIFGKDTNNEWEKLVARATRETASEKNPARQAATARRLATRHMDELIGLCQGILFDGAVTDGEARNLLKWIESHRDAAQTWPGNVLYDRIVRAMIDGKIDPEEEKELIDVLSKERAFACRAVPSYLRMSRIVEMPFDAAAQRCF